MESDKEKELCLELIEDDRSEKNVHGNRTNAPDVNLSSQNAGKEVCVEVIKDDSSVMNCDVNKTNAPDVYSSSQNVEGKEVCVEVTKDDSSDMICDGDKTNAPDVSLSSQNDEEKEACAELLKDDSSEMNNDGNKTNAPDVCLSSQNDEGKEVCVKHIKDDSSDMHCDENKTNATDVSLSSQNDENELRVGMVTHSEEEAFDMYNKYACSKGFSVRKHQRHFKKGTKEVIRRTLVCSKEGFREFTAPGEIKNVERPDARCGCRARVIFKVENGVYQISQLITDHNHPLVEPNKRQFLRSARKIYEAADARRRTSQTYAYGVGGCQNVGSVDGDYIQVKRPKKIASADCQSLLNHFAHKQAVVQQFFYTVQVDDESRVTNFFWRDGLSKLDYECFGDVVIFDTTYHNKYNMICAPFFGVNHHGKNVLYGCAFLSDGTISSLVWLFDAFLESMDGKAPKTIFTDQDDAMVDAIARVLPNTQHRLCQWHISKNVTLNISGLHHQSGFKRRFSYLLDKCESEAEFEKKWKRMMNKWGCSNESWLLKLYNLREKWAPAFNRDTFSSIISYSQRSASIDNIFQHMACKTMTLVELADHYEQNVEKLREAELIDDYNCAHGNPRIVSRSSGILQDACKVYTHKLFAMFQDEFVQSLCVVEVESTHNETHHMYKLKMEDNEQERVVQFDSSDLSISCSCKQFESMGLLCCHALRVLNLNGVTKLPEQYILHRWTKAVRHGFEMDRNYILPENTSGNSAKMVRLNKLMRNVFNLMNLCANSDATTEIADLYLDNILQQVVEFYAPSNEEYDALDDSIISISTSETTGQKRQTLENDKESGNTPRSVGIQSPVMDPSNLYPFGVQMSENCQNQFISIFGMPAPSIHTSLPATNPGYSNCITGSRDVPHFNQEYNQ